MQRKIPAHLICTITRDIYLEPVIVFPSGQTYEKQAVDKLIAQARLKGKKALCPLSRIPIDNDAINWAMKSAVADHLEKYPEDVAKQYKLEEQQPAPQVIPASAVTPDRLRQLQIQEDESLARELQGQDDAQSRIAETLRAERDARTLAAMRERRDRDRLAAEAARLRNIEVRQDSIELNFQDKQDRDALVKDLQDLIYALEFETGPQPRGSIQNDSLVFFAIVESLFFMEPLPWQKIKVAEGPKSTAMYETLKAAMKALKEINPAILHTAKQDHSGEYDLVKPLLSGPLSLNNDGYAKFARAMGTIKNQPGYLVDQILLRADHLLQQLQRKYSAAATTYQHSLSR